MEINISKILNQFVFDGEIIDVARLGNGHINLTYSCLTNTNKRYVLQKINNNVFKDVDLLMKNYSLVTDFLTGRGVETIKLAKTKNGKYYCFVDGGYYRLFDYIENVICYEEINNNELVYKSAQAFGKLHKALKNFDATKLGEIIPNFHNTYQRYVNLLNAIKGDQLNRVKNCLSEIELVKSFEQEFGIVSAAINSGLIPLAVTHNDPKINNVLFDKDSGDVRAVIDLDTVMPGSYLYDFGDALRSLFTGDNEDSENLSLLKVNYEIFETYTKGYLSEMKGVLTKREIELLPFSAFLLTIECGIRFLEDYIRGDVYFRVAKPNHNLIRARTQLTLAKDIFSKLDKLNEIVERLL